MIYALQYLNCLLITNSETFHKFKWLGTFMTMTAAIVIAVSLDFAQQPWPFVIYLGGAFIWSYSAILMRDWPLLCLNLLFIATDTYAISIRL